MEREYFDSQGRSVSLEMLCRLEPEWASSRIETMEAELAEARELLKWVWKDEREWIGGRLCDAIEVAIDGGKEK